ncbi:hypothetical protein PF003_g24830 [Phytophthora fragariae]|nr:hypothetical protein PF003_g24830 [Phytophthora fragariae]
MEFKNFASSTKKVPFTSPYPPLVLSAKEKKQLRQLAKTLVEVNVDAYEQFLYENKGKLPESEWKFFRRDQQVETYLRRRDEYNLRGFGATKKFRRGSDTSSTASTSSARSEELSSLDVADIRSIGSRDGTIEDAVYGAMGPLRRRCPTSPYYSRGQVAAIGFWRQTAPNVVEIHGRGVFALPFERARALFVPVVTTSMSKSVMHIFYAAHMKKLRWALTQRKTRDLARSQSSVDRVCSVCNKKRTIRQGDDCDLCGDLVCSVCRITHKVASVGLENKMHWTKAHVCPFCMTKVINLDTAAVVCAEIKAGWYDRFP